MIGAVCLIVVLVFLAFMVALSVRVAVWEKRNDLSEIHRALAQSQQESRKRKRSASSGGDDQVSEAELTDTDAGIDY